MRAAFAVAGIAVLAVAGLGSAHDALLPVLLKEHPGAQAAPGSAPGASAQTLPPPAAGSSTAFGVALLGAALVTLGTLAWVSRRPRSSA